MLNKNQCEIKTNFYCGLNHKNCKRIRNFENNKEGFINHLRDHLMKAKRTVFKEVDYSHPELQGYVIYEGQVWKTNFNEIPELKVGIISNHNKKCSNNISKKKYLDDIKGIEIMFMCASEKRCNIIYNKQQFKYHFKEKHDSIIIKNSIYFYKKIEKDLTMEEFEQIYIQEQEDFDEIMKNAQNQCNSCLSYFNLGDSYLNTIFFKLHCDFVHQSYIPKNSVLWGLIFVDEIFFNQQLLSVPLIPSNISQIRAEMFHPFNCNYIECQQEMKYNKFQSLNEIYVHQVHKHQGKIEKLSFICSQLLDRGQINNLSQEDRDQFFKKQQNYIQNISHQNKQISLLYKFIFQYPENKQLIIDLNNTKILQFMNKSKLKWKHAISKKIFTDAKSENENNIQKKQDLIKIDINLEQQQIKNYECNICQKTFESQNVLSTHQKLYHLKI